ncbi:MAG: hypothetical protein HA494_02535 [Thaumarchaeota archaeon]|nr:hypothetical protein [Nitrososphaerota archaeon]
MDQLGSISDRLSGDIEVRVLEKLTAIIEDVKSGLDPDLLASWYDFIVERAKEICPDELRDTISVERDPILTMKFHIKASRRAVPYLLDVIEEHLPQMPFATRLYFQKVEEILEQEAARFDGRKGEEPRN